jgi:hypothetical protein
MEVLCDFDTALEAVSESDRQELDGDRAVIEDLSDGGDQVCVAVF